MTTEQFWQLLDGTHGADDRVAALTEGLGKLSAEEIVQFRVLLDDLLQSAHQVDLWGAAHLIQGGCSEEDFAYFRDGLLASGQKTFEAAVNEPDALAELLPGKMDLADVPAFEEAPLQAWVAKTGLSADDYYSAVDFVDSGDRNVDEEGEHWDFGDPEELQERLPRLTAKYAKNS